MRKSFKIYDSSNLLHEYQFVVARVAFAINQGLCQTLYKWCIFSPKIRPFHFLNKSLFIRINQLVIFYYEKMWKVVMEEKFQKKIQNFACHLNSFCIYYLLRKGVSGGNMILCWHKKIPSGVLKISTHNNLIKMTHIVKSYASKKLLFTWTKLLWSSFWENFCQENLRPK